MTTNKIKGDDYEYQIKNYIINNLNKNAFLWSETPINILINAGIIKDANDHRLIRKNNKINPLIDTGIDIIQIDDNDNNLISIVQCKNGYKNGITMQDLAGFMCWMTHLQDINGYVYYTNKLSQNIKNLPSNKRINYIKHLYEINSNDNTNLIIPSKMLEDTLYLRPYLYQYKALWDYDLHFIKNNRAILSLPCGTGKTYTSYLISRQYKQIIILSPLKQFAKQNLERFIEYGYNKDDTLLVDSDGTRDIEYIENFIKSKTSFLISSTFCSIDIIYKLIDQFEDVFFIIDEFHNLSKNNVTDKDDDFYKLLNNSDNKILFVSATPRIYELEDCNSDEFFNDEIFGEIIYNMSFNYAITNGYICDYRIWLPSIHENNDKLLTELSIYNIDKIAKINFLFSCLLNNGSRKCIIYCIDTEEIKLMIESIHKLNDFYYLDYEIDEITSKTNQKEREKILNNFAISKKLNLLFSIRILDECIDIPSCDSIFITYPTQSKIRTIQRLSRSLRIDKNNKYKIANIFIWCSEYASILETLSGIKEYDINFKDKIKINETRFYRETKKNEENEGLLEDIKLINDYIIGIKEFKQYSWYDKLEEVKNYIDKNNKAPSTKDTDKKIKKMGQWISHWKKNYDMHINKCKKGMKDKEIHYLWTEFITDNKYKKYINLKELWYEKLEEIKDYINKNNKSPSQSDKDEEIKQIGQWISHQKKNYDIDINKCKYSMKDEDIYNKWTEFITNNKYKKYIVINLKQLWYKKLEKLKKYIDENNKSPSRSDKDEEIKQIGSWINTQKKNYDIDINKCKNGMKDDEIYTKWTEFITNNKYKKYIVINLKELWYEKLNEVKEYIDTNNKSPSRSDKDENINQMGQWISHQKTNYDIDINKCKEGMKNKEIYNKWTEFITDNKYNKYFKTVNNKI
jgi:superfamily II DNA or RNA helicase